MRRHGVTSALAFCAALTCGSTAAQTQPPTDDATTQSAAEPAAKPAAKPGWRELMHDPKDGKFDMSRWLLDRKGFLPVPIIVSDPAVGYGGGIAALFFHRPAGATTTRTTADGRPQLVPPNIFGGMAMKTENGTHAYGGGAMLHFKDDRWRYTGGVAKASVNLDFYTPGRFTDPLAIGYNADGLVSFQKIARRLGDENLFLGVSWTYMDLDLSFDVADDASRFTPRERAEVTSGLGVSLQYDQRDNSFSPNSGWLGQIEGNFYDDAFGSDTDFQSYRSHAFAYLPMGGDRFVLGGRADVRWANGDIPFYRLPFIDLRGVGSARYADTRAATLETELRWNTTPRWALIGFIGAGRTWGRHNDFGDAPSQVAKGAGVRYKIASVLGLYTGIDYAWGPEDETLYVQVGSAWR